MQEIWKVRSFSHWFFHDFFMNFFHFEKNSGFSISCTSHRRGDMYRNFTPSDPIFPLWARAPTARAVPVELCMFFITFSTVFLLILLGTWVRFAWTWKNILICQVFFDRGCSALPNHCVPAALAPQGPSCAWGCRVFRGTDSGGLRTVTRRRITA